MDHFMNQSHTNWVTTRTNKREKQNAICCMHIRAMPEQEMICKQLSTWDTFKVEFSSIRCASFGHWLIFFPLRVPTFLLLYSIMQCTFSWKNSKKLQLCLGFMSLLSLLWRCARMNFHSKSINISYFTAGNTTRIQLISSANMFYISHSKETLALKPNFEF